MCKDLRLFLLVIKCMNVLPFNNLLGLVHEGSHKDSTHGGYLTLLHETKMSVALGSRSPYMSGMKETILVLLCLGQAVSEMKLVLLGFAVTRAQRHVAGFKVNPSCPKCNVS
ncbi:hypothetical protein TNCV_3909151 [Trichonephila clavipes]|nr:hypothetical protein TNCV_3909151 [Trichonephila clavipes]